MKVLLVNGSPKKEGSTFAALSIVAEELAANGVETEIFQLANQQGIEGCRGCGYCFKNDGCVIGDIVNEFVEKAYEADGFIFGTPVHFAGASGALTSFLNRVFYSNYKTKAAFRGKPGSAIAVCRRGGSSATLDQINRYFGITGMPTVPSQYWNMIHGNSPAEVAQDLEGVQILQILAKNMAWLMRCIEAGKSAGIELPPLERVKPTNFIR